MKIPQRAARTLILLALFMLMLLPLVSYAQEGTPEATPEGTAEATPEGTPEPSPTVSIGGSAIAGGVLQALISASGSTAEVVYDFGGTDAGLEQLCAGLIDAATTNRPISLDDENACASNAVEYIEYLLGHNILTVITHPDLTFVECADLNTLSRIFEPSAAGQINDWILLNLNAEDPPPPTPITIYLPPLDTAQYAMLDRLVTGVGLRSDAVIEADEAARIEAVNSTPGAIGIVSLHAAEAAEDVRILELNSGDDNNCHPPSAQNVEDRLYGAAERLFLYVTRAGQNKPGVDEALSFLASEEAAPIVAELGFTPPSAEVYALTQAVIESGEAGRQFSLELVSFQIPPDVFGTLTVAGSAHLGSYVETLATQFSQQYAGVTSTVEVRGQPEGAQRFCNREIDLLLAYQPLSAEDAANCEDNFVVPVTLDLGNSAVVIIANDNPDMTPIFAGEACLTPAQLRTLWAATAADPVNQWAALGEGFADLALTLFSVEGQGYTDLLLTPLEGGPALALRDDVAEVNPDPLYRAAATGNTEGGLTYMSWSEYQDVVENGQENLQLVAVDAGAGCVTPSVETITEGGYPLIRQHLLIVSQDSLARIEVQSLLWYLISDENFTALETLGVVGMELTALPTLRDQLQEDFDAAAAAALIPDPTPEATDAALEGTSEATPQSGEATPEPTPEATEAGE
jgi:phosphate transport system substrate-binding protein